MRKDKRKTEIYAFRVSQAEKKLLHDVSLYSSSATSDIVRDSALFTAGTILAIQNGELTPEQAAKRYVELLAELSDYVPMIYGGKPAEDESGDEAAA